MTLRTRLEDTLDRSPAAPSLLVVSDSHVGSTLATEFAATADTSLVADSERVAARTPDSVRTIAGDVTDRDTLAAAAVDGAVAVVALRRDRRALLVAQLLWTHADIRDCILLLNDPQRHDAVADVSTAVVCGSSCLSSALGDAVEQTLSEHTEPHS
ncbi:NAD-binding protein [Haloarcula sediminis]|uniref:NAD-binding protein n=1 Tax=Haloarcula sediminis TaxID=3111777 RepID=UPI002D793E17|nr:NAD-binding protein [Haloarcula sp. CK38]